MTNGPHLYTNSRFAVCESDIPVFDQYHILLYQKLFPVFIIDLVYNAHRKKHLAPSTSTPFGKNIENVRYKLRNWILHTNFALIFNLSIIEHNVIPCRVANNDVAPRHDYEHLRRGPKWGCACIEINVLCHNAHTYTEMYIYIISQTLGYSICLFMGIFIMIQNAMSIMVQMKKAPVFA